MWPTTRITLLARIRDTGDTASWRAFVDLYAPIVYAYCRHRGLQDADAQNVSQEVFARVSQAIRSFEYDSRRGRFRSWLGLITHQQLLRYREKEQHAQRGGTSNMSHSILDSFEGEVEGAWIDTFNSHIYATALTNVQAESDTIEWRVFQRVFNDGEGPADIAGDVQKETQWIYQVKHKMVKRLKEEIERLTDDVALFHRS